MKRNRKDHGHRERPTRLMKIPSIRGFDYSALESPEARARVEAAATRIRELNRSMASAAVEIGLELIVVREELGPRLFSVWLASEWNWSQATASNLMMIARKFSDLECLDKFDHSALYEIARPRVDPAAVSETIERARAGERISKAKALTIIERYEMASETDPAPKPRRDEVGRLKSLVRTTIGRWPAAEREELARQLMRVVSEVLIEFGLSAQTPRATPRLAAPGKSKPVRADVHSRSHVHSHAAAAIGIAVG